MEKSKNLVSARTKTPFYKKKRWKIVFLVFVIVLIFAVSFIAYVLAQSSKVFKGGSIIKTIRGGLGQTETLKGQKDGRINIIFTGIGGANHPGGQLTDSLMVISFKPEDNSMAMLSIPRDLYVPIAGSRNSIKINEVLAVGEKDKRGSGPELLKKTLEGVLGIPVHYFVTVDFAGFEKTIDEIGGIDVTVEKTIYDPLFPDKNMVGYDPFMLKAGPAHLNGEIALKYARSRETSSDFDRAARQQKIVSASRDKILKLGFLANPKKILDLSTIAGDHLRTDISPAEIKSFAELIKKLDNGKIISRILTNGNDGPLVSDSSSGTYLLLPRGGNFDKIKEITKDLFATTTKNEVSEKDKVKIEVLNGAQTAGLANKLGQTLQDYGYTITDIRNAPAKSSQTIINDYSGGQFPETIGFLRRGMNTIVTKKNVEQKTGADISITIGNDYKGFTDKD